MYEEIHIPIPYNHQSMYVNIFIFTYIWLIFMVNVGKYSMNGCYGNFLIELHDLMWSSPRIKQILPQKNKWIGSNWGIFFWHHFKGGWLVPRTFTVHSKPFFFFVFVWFDHILDVYLSESDVFFWVKIVEDQKRSQNLLVTKKTEISEFQPNPPSG